MWIKIEWLDMVSSREEVEERWRAAGGRWERDDEDRAANLIKRSCEMVTRRISKLELRTNVSQEIFV